MLTRCDLLQTTCADTLLMQLSPETSLLKVRTDIFVFVYRIANKHSSNLHICHMTKGFTQCMCVHLETDVTLMCLLLAATRGQNTTAD